MQLDVCMIFHIAIYCKQHKYDTDNKYRKPLVVTDNIEEHKIIMKSNDVVIILYLQDILQYLHNSERCGIECCIFA